MMLESKFWEWFLAHEKELSEFDPLDEKRREALFDEVALELQKVDPDLTFEFGPEEVSREFIISAGGIRRAFQAVVSLANSAPWLNRWKVISFRPRRFPVHPVDFQGKHIDPNDVQVTLLDNGKTAGIQMFVPGLEEDNLALKSIGYLLLDEALGEYDVETRLGLIEMLPTEAATTGNRHPLAELPKLFDELVARIECRTGKSS